MYFTVGYPLGMNSINHDTEPEPGLLLELQSDVIQLRARQSAVYNLTAAWDSVNPILKENVSAFCVMLGLTGDEIDIITDELERLHALIEVKSDDEFLDKLGAFKPIRQGVSNFVIEDIEKFEVLNPCINLGPTQTPITDFQLEIWKKSNGKITLKDMFNTYFLDSTISDFISEFRFLKGNALIYLI